jgi:hypothetical protein
MVQGAPQFLARLGRVSLEDVPNPLGLLHGYLRDGE